MASKGKRTKNETCVLCCKPIVEGKEEALMCEGEICSNKWMHRYCAGVPTTHYKLLEESPEPFCCYLCVQLKHAALVEEMKSTIASLTAEVVELRATLESEATRSSPGGQVQTSSGASQTIGRSWTEVVRHGTRRAENAGQGRRRPRRTQPANNSSSSNRSGNSLNQANSNSAGANNQQNEARVMVPGVRRVWGTKQDAPPAVVLQTIRQLTKTDSDKRLTVKRKFKDGGPG